MRLFNILSPDEIPISPDPFTSKKAAWSYFKEWKERFTQQGYYSTIVFGDRFELPLNRIKRCCELVEYDEDFMAEYQKELA